MKRQDFGSVLILEDEELIVLDIEDCLLRIGFAIAGAFPSSSAALEWLKANRDDVALRDGGCSALARILRARGIPFVIHSANKHDPVFQDEAFSGARWLAKPSRHQGIIAALKEVLLVKSHGDLLNAN